METLDAVSIALLLGSMLVLLGIMSSLVALRFEFTVFRFNSVVQTLPIRDLVAASQNLFLQLGRILEAGALCPFKESPRFNAPCQLSGVLHTLDEIAKFGVAPSERRDVGVVAHRLPVDHLWCLAEQ